MQSTSNSRASPPTADCLEVSLLGPGYGEAVLVHLGDGKWIAVDSCLGARPKSCAPLDYLNSIGVDPSEAVVAIVVSHWDDDHIRGLAQLVAAAPAAKVISSAAILEDDFLKLVQLVNGDRTRFGKTGVHEIARVYDLLEAGRRSITNAIQNREIFLSAFNELSHGEPVKFQTLSPADAELNNFIAWVGSQMPEVGDAMRRFPKRSRNDLSVVVSIQVGSQVILLGGDLEEEGQPSTGWSAVLSSKAGAPWSRAGVFKVAHHGSHTGFHQDVWDEMLVPQPIAILAPWIHGGGVVPSKEDRDAVLAQTPHAYTTTTVRYKRSPDRSRAALRTIAENVANFRSNEPIPGHLRLRRRVGDESSAWEVEMFQGAMELASWPQASQQQKPAALRRRSR